MSVGLNVIDIQKDYFPSGKMALEGSGQAGQVAGGLLGFFREHRLPVFHIQHISIVREQPFSCQTAQALKYIKASSPSMVQSFKSTFPTASEKQACWNVYSGQTFSSW